MQTRKLDTQQANRPFDWKCPCCPLGIYGKLMNNYNQYRRRAHGWTSHPGADKSLFHLPKGSAERTKKQWSTIGPSERRRRHAKVSKTKRAGWTARCILEAAKTPHDITLTCGPCGANANRPLVFCKKCGRHARHVVGLGTCQPLGATAKATTQRHLERVRAELTQAVGAS